MKLFPILLTLLFLSCCSPKSSESPLHSDPLKLTNVKYGPYERNVMDVYLPKNRTKDTPFVINLHGGAWTLGDKVWGESISEYFYQHNVAVINMNYRFADDGATHLDKLLDDINTAIHYIKSHATEWNVRKSGFSITGESAGAHLALSYAYKYPQNIKAIMTRCAPTDFGDPENLKMAAKNNLLGALDKMSGNRMPVNPTGKAPEKYLTASPVNHIKDIPTLIFHGEQDALVSSSQAKRLSAALEKKKYIHQLILIPGASHNILMNDNDREMIYSESLAWIKKYGK